MIVRFDLGRSEKSYLRPGLSAVDQGNDVTRLRHEHCHVSPQQLVWTDARRAGNGARDGADCAIELSCVMCDLHRSRPHAGFNHDRRCGQCGHQPCTGKEPMAGWRCTRGHLTDHQSDGSDATEQFAMARRIRAINSVRKDCNGFATGRERRAMGSAFDAVRTACNDDPLGGGQIGRQSPGHVLAIGGCSSCAR